jgi:hypothetical protein
MNHNTPILVWIKMKWIYLLYDIMEIIIEELIYMVGIKNNI